MNVATCFNFFNFLSVCAQNLTPLKWLVGYKFEEKTSNERQLLRTLEGVIFARNKNCSN